MAGTGKSTVKSQSRFATIPSTSIQRSKFNRSCGVKTTFDAGFLIPFFVDEVLPGDTFNASVTLFGRLATPLHPVLENMYVDYFFFFVPNRLVWSNWERFNGEQDAPGDSTDFLVPQYPTDPQTGFLFNSMADYLGLPPSVPGLTVNALPFRSVNLIWNEWFRDQNLQDPAEVPKDDGPDALALYPIRRRGKRHDYFTSCLPWPQKGPAVSLPLTGNAPLVGSVVGSGDLVPRFDVDNLTATALETQQGGEDVRWSGNAANSDIEAQWNDPKLTYSGDSYADLSAVTASTINDLREAFQLQRMYERDARGGTRYTEILRSHFGVVSPDSRLQRPEFLAGGTATISVNPVAQTSSSDATSPQGNLSGFGTVQHRGRAFVKSFTEHGHVIGLVCMRADLNYQQGVERMWNRSTRFDYYWPTLAHLGEQAVLNKEIYAQGTPDDDLVFGYQERYAEYRYKPSRVTGKFRSISPQSLDSWHLAQDFAELPALNASFIQEDPPVQRIIAVPSEPHLILDAYISLNCARPMPTYSVPGLIDHF